MFSMSEISAERTVRSLDPASIMRLFRGLGPDAFAPDSFCNSPLIIDAATQAFYRLHLRKYLNT